MKKSESVQAQKRILARSGAVPARAEKGWIDHAPEQAEVSSDGKPKPKKTEWERGREEAIICGAGRWNNIFFGVEEA